MVSETTRKFPICSLLGWAVVVWVVGNAALLPTPLQRAHTFGGACVDSMRVPLGESGESCAPCRGLEGIMACDVVDGDVVLEVEPGGLWFGVVPAWNYRVVFGVPDGAACDERLMGVSSSEAIGW